MRKLRLLIAAVVLGVAAGPASAEDFWGRKTADQPTNFIFGYGSLINTAWRNSTATKPIAAIPARLGTGFGYVRCWCDRSSSGFTALGLRRPEPGESAMKPHHPTAGGSGLVLDTLSLGRGHLAIRVGMRGIDAMPTSGGLVSRPPVVTASPRG